MGWEYDAGDHGQLGPVRAPAAAPATLYAVGLQCSSSGKLYTAGVREAFPSSPGCLEPGMFCNRLDATMPVTMVMVARAVVAIGETTPPGAVPIGRLQGVRCTPPSPSLGPSEEYASYAERQPHNPLEHLRRRPRTSGASASSLPSAGAWGRTLEGPAPHRVPRQRGARHRSPIGGRSAFCRRVARRPTPAVPPVCGAPLLGGGGARRPVARPPAEWLCIRKSPASASGWSRPGGRCWQPSTCTYRQPCQQLGAGRL